MATQEELSTTTASNVLGESPPPSTLQQPHGALEMAKMSDPVEGSEPPPNESEQTTGDAEATSSDTKPLSKGKEKMVVALRAAAVGEGSTSEQASTGPASPTTAEPVAAAGGPPVCNITLLLQSGSRHPYKIDEKYLAK